MATRKNSERYMAYYWASLQDARNSGGDPKQLPLCAIHHKEVKIEPVLRSPDQQMNQEFSVAHPYKRFDFIACCEEAIDEAESFIKNIVSKF